MKSFVRARDIGFGFILHPSKMGQCPYSADFVATAAPDVISEPVSVPKTTLSCPPPRSSGCSRVCASLVQDLRRPHVELQAEAGMPGTPNKSTTNQNMP